MNTIQLLDIHGVPNPVKTININEVKKDMRPKKHREPMYFIITVGKMIYRYMANEVIVADNHIVTNRTNGIEVPIGAELDPEWDPNHLDLNDVDDALLYLYLER